MKEIIKEGLDKLKINKLAVWDFDGTLINTELPEDGKRIYKEKTGKDWQYIGWWSKKESLDMTIFDMPVIKQTIDSYKIEKANPNTLNVMMTGRMVKLSNEVEAILSAKGLSFDKYIYNMGGSTLDSKINSLDKLLLEYPNVTDILVTDDRQEHIPTFEAWCKQKLEEGRISTYKIDVIPSGHH